MLIRRQLLETLDTPIQLLLVEAISGAGKRTLLTQWGSEAGDEHRIVVDASKAPPTRQGIASLIGSELSRGSERRLCSAKLSRESLPEDLLRGLAGLTRPVAVGILATDRLQTEAVDFLLEAIEAASQLRLVVTGADLACFRSAVQGRPLAFASLGDRDLFLTPDELRQIIASHGITPTERNTTALLRSTHGHVGMVEAAITQLPLECELGTVQLGQPLSAYFLTRSPEAWAAGLGRLVAQLADVPRLTIEEARLITGDADVVTRLHRLQALGAGRMTYHPGLRQRVFSWLEPFHSYAVENVVKPSPAGRDAVDRLIEISGSCEDRELHAATLARAGEFERAEAMLRDWLWDVLPNPGHQPLWRHLELIAPADLAEFPGLLSIRARLAHGTPSAPIAQSVVQTVSAQLLEDRHREPWDRLQALTRSVLLIHYTELHAEFAERAIRARDLAVDLATAELDRLEPAAVSDVLLLTTCLLQKGNSTAAAELAELATRMIATAPARLDPAGERQGFAARVRLLSYRERGLDDPVEADLQLSGLQFLQREADIVAAYVCAMWTAIDDGERMLADAHGRICAERLQEPREWPLLIWARVQMAAQRRSLIELERTAGEYEWSRQWAAGATSLPPITPLHQAGNEMLRRGLGIDCPLPEFLPPTAAMLADGFYPRIEYAAELVRAVLALRAGQHRSAQACLERALGFVPRHPLSPSALGMATEAEIGQLAELVKDHPDANRIPWEQAISVAGYAAPATTDLSEREREVLMLLREGATNPQMAEAMFLSVNTVKFHRANLMRKLGATTRLELLELAAALHL